MAHRLKRIARPRWLPAAMLLPVMMLLQACAGVGNAAMKPNACVGLVPPDVSAPLAPVVTQNTPPPLIGPLEAGEVDNMMGRIFESNLDDPARVTRRAAQPPVVDIHILALSTGGQYGAFAGGFLDGWGARGTRPEFDLVTGASAGGVIAPIVFAGADFDDRLALTRDIGEADVVTSNGVIGILLGRPSLYGTGPLEARVAGAITPDMMDAIAQRWEQGDEILLGATDLHSGRFDLLHVGEFAARSKLSFPEKRDCLTDAVMATSAIPGLFPPRPIGTALYADAGLREHIFLDDVAEGLRRQAVAENARLNVQVTLLINSDLRVREVDVGQNLQEIATRSFDLVIDEGLRNSVLSTIRVAQEAGWNLRAARMPDVDALDCTPKDRELLFSNCITRGLYDAGRAAALLPDPFIGPDELRRRIMEF